MGVLRVAVTGASRATAKRDLEDLVRKDLLAPKGLGEGPTTRSRSNGPPMAQLAHQRAGPEMAHKWLKWLTGLALTAPVCAAVGLSALYQHSIDNRC